MAEDPIIQASADRFGLDIFVSFYQNSNCIQRMRARPLQPRREDNSKIFLKFENYFSFAKGSHYFSDYILSSFASLYFGIFNNNKIIKKSSCNKAETSVKAYYSGAVDSSLFNTKVEKNITNIILGVG